MTSSMAGLFKPRPERRHKEEESASSVQRAYEKRIDHFLRDVDAPTNLLGQRDNTLDGVFSWGKRLMSDKRKAERSLDEYVQAYQNTQAQANDLKKRLERTQARLQERETQLQLAESKIQHMEGEKNRMLSQHAREKQNTREKHEDTVARMAMDHSRTVKTLHDDYDVQVTQLVSKHQHEVYKLNEDMKKLVAQLLVSQSDNEGWPDDKLKSKFNELRQLIDSTTSPRNKEFSVPEGRALGPRLDPTNFVGRIGAGRSHYLLKTAIWKILQEQFFATPFGFGAFGPGKGHAEIMNVYFTWRGLFDGKGRSPTDNDAIALLRRDRTANTWRNATFQTIYEALTGSSSHSQSLIAQLNAENTQRTVDRIWTMFLEVSKLSNSQIRREVEDEIRQMATVASQLAIQFGVHPAQLQLSFPKSGERVEIGSDFQDCEDGEENKGAIYPVDLVVVPGLQKIGDGKSDMASKRSIVPCEIFPVDQS